MTELGDVFGEDFEQKYKQKENMRQEKRRKVDKETLMEACWHAVNGGGFDGEEPRFTFDAGEMEYDVMLMQAPENNLSKFIHEFGDDGKTLGMFHLGELFSCAFLGDMQELITKIDEGEHYIVVGTYQENTKTKNGKEETYFNINPVAGIAPIAQAKKYADKMDEQMQGSTIDEQAEQQSKDESSEEEDDELDLSDDDEGDGSRPSEQDVMKVFRAVSNKKEEIIRSVADGDSDALTKLTQFVSKNTEGEITEDYIADIFEDNIEPIEGRGEDEDEEDDMDLGLDEDDEDDGMDLGDDEEEEEETTESESSDEEEDDEESDVDDWF